MLEKKAAEALEISKEPVSIIASQELVEKDVQEVVQDPLIGVWNNDDNDSHDEEDEEAIPEGLLHPKEDVSVKISDFKKEDKNLLDNAPVVPKFLPAQMPKKRVGSILVHPGTLVFRIKLNYYLIPF